MAVGLWLTATAANTVTLTSVQGHPGDEVEIAVMLTTADEVTAIELLVPLGNMLSYVNGSAAINAERANGHQLAADVRDGKLSMVVFSPTLAPIKGVDGELCRFTVKLGKEPADYTLTPEVVMSDASGNALTCSVESGVVTLLSPKIEVTTPTIDYGRVPIRNTYTQTLSVKNVGNEPLEITGFTFENKNLSVSPSVYTIAAGRTQSITLIYAPMLHGTIESGVTIHSNAINPKAGKAVVKAQPYSVNELHVQRAEGVSDKEVTVSLKMNNMEPIAGVQCSFTLPDQLIYVEGSAAPGSRCEGTDHQVSGAMNGKVLTLFMYSTANQVLPEGDGELLTFRVRLNGASGSYQLKPTDVVLSNVTMENMVSATSNNYVVISSPKISANNAIDMGSVAVTEKCTATYSIYNSGKVDLVISKAAFLAEGYAVETELPLTIARSQTKQIAISYTPTVEGEHKTMMQLYTNDPTCRMKSVAVNGSVYEPNSVTVSYTSGSEGKLTYHLGLSNYSDIVAIQLDIHCPQAMSVVTEEAIATERLKHHAFTISDIGNGVYRVLIYSMANIPIEGKEGRLLSIPFTLNGNVDVSSIVLKDVLLSDSRGAIRDVTVESAILIGDVNGDGNVNIADAIGVVNYVLKNEMTTFVAEAADMNGDGSINIADAIAIVNQILKM